MEYNFNELKEIVKSKVNSKRFVHILGVVEMAKKLSKLYLADTHKCETAALLHDICKEMDLSEMKKICVENFSSELTEEDFNNNEILHGFAAAYWIEKYLNIHDKEILDAVKYHTIGSSDLSLVGKIVYIADAIEIGRDYPSVDIIRKTTFQNLNQGILLEIQNKDKFLKSIGKSLHKNTLQLEEKINTILKN